MNRDEVALHQTISLACRAQGGMIPEISWDAFVVNIMGQPAQPPSLRAARRLLQRLLTRGLVTYEAGWDGIFDLTAIQAASQPHAELPIGGVPLGEMEQRGKVFLVHGHNNLLKEAVARFLERAGLRVIVLHEQPDGGRHILDKFEHYADISSFAVVLLTADDVGASATNPTELRGRARQNVIFELGYFAAKLGRERVRCLHQRDVEIPSDYIGVLCIAVDANAWPVALARELSAAGIPINASRALGMEGT